MLRYLTAGESHGKCLIAILEGMVAGLTIDIGLINRELSRRQAGYGRSRRMKIESDKVEILSGLRRSETIGSPIALLVKNKAESIDSLPFFTNPRPGHADLAGALKYNRRDLRDVLERASARETACRVAVGAITRQLLSEFKIDILSHVVNIAGITADSERLSFDEVKKKCRKSRLNCADKAAEKLMINKIDEAARSGDTAGGIFKIIVKGVPPGLGSHVSYDRRLDGSLAKAIASIPSVKGVEFGIGFGAAAKTGSKVHDEIFYKKGKGFYRSSNNAGGIEGGISNGEDVVLSAAIKPISTLRSPLKSVDVSSKKQMLARFERADICVVASAGIIAEAVLAFEIAKLMLEKFGGDSMEEMKRNYQGYIKQVKEF
ncbi:MAG: chorismate synthase [Candidatus Omnitrophota bacterium]|nr:chorismate synthase [Candidatus Omnitrophota bacterium]